MEERNPISVRGLVDSDYGTPLRKFTGVLDSYSDEPAKGYEGTRVNLNFKELEVAQSVEPYNLPIFVLNIGLSNRKKSRWGYLGTSLTELIPDEEDLKHQIGRRMGLVFCDGQEGRPAPKLIWRRDADREEYPTGEVPTPVWVVFEVEGVTAGETSGAISATEQAKRLLDGKPLSEFNAAAYADLSIRKNPDLQRSITDKNFVKAMLATGEFTKDSNGIYHRV